MRKCPKGLFSPVRVDRDKTVNANQLNIAELELQLNLVFREIFFSRKIKTRNFSFYIHLVLAQVANMCILQC